MAGHVVGQTSTDAVYIDGNVTVKGDMTGPVSAKMVLRDPTVDIAVLETARGGIVRSGLGYMYCDVGAVLNVTSDHLGLGGVDTVDELARVKRVVVEVARDTAVLNADNEQTLKMAAYTTAKNLFYVTRNPHHELVREHIRLGKRAIVLEEGLNGDQIVIYDNGTQIPLIWTHLILPPSRARRSTMWRMPCSRRPWPMRWARRWTRSATACAPSTTPSSSLPAA